MNAADFDSIKEYLERTKVELLKEGVVSTKETAFTAIVSIGTAQVIRAAIVRGLLVSPGDRAILMRVSPSHPWVLIATYNLPSTGATR